MSYYRECYRCGAALDPGEVCDCVGEVEIRKGVEKEGAEKSASRDGLVEMILKLNDEQCELAARAFMILTQNPAMTAAESVKKAALTLQRQDGKTETTAHDFLFILPCEEGVVNA